jgi:Tol biopolymer transport system component
VKEAAMIAQQRRWSRKTTIGALAVTAAIGLAGLAAVLTTHRGETAPTRSANVLTEAGPAPAERGVPKVDYMLDLDTGAKTPLPDAIIVSVAGFGRSAETKYAASADGSKLAYVGFGDENPQIFVARIDGGGVRQLTHDVREAMSPAWSPDGARIAYVGYGARWAGNARHLFVVDVATGVSTRVTGVTGDVWSPQFTPNGTSIIYTGGRASSPVIRVVPATGGKSTVFLAPRRGLTDTGNGSLSPDGSLVTFLAGGWPKEAGHHCGPCRFVANADGTDRRVLYGECWGSSPAGTWSPDGSRIVCSDDINSIVVVDVARERASRVAEGRSAIWLDPQTLLVHLA